MTHEVLKRANTDVAAVIPDRLGKALHSDSTLHADVLRSITVLKPWIGDHTTGLTFFPEYTDHGLHHIANVLAAADALITDRARTHLTPTDIAVLVLAVFLHDAAMHLTVDGFNGLIKPSENSPLIIPLDSEPWEHLWNAFSLEARKWSDRKRQEVFGCPSSSGRVFRVVSDPPHHSEERPWNEHHYRLVGEFIRRHHARLAHEIAIAGVPGPQDHMAERLKVSVDPPLRDLAGLVARSHGMQLRATFDYLESKYSVRQEQFGVHTVYLMALLRIADYLEIDADRAPSELSTVRSLRSPVSRAEWELHDAVRVKSRQHPDPEALLVHATPENARTFVRCTRLLTAIQAELDTTWAVLGEVYHSMRNPHWQNLELSLRRIRSNLDDVCLFKRAENIQYHPIDARFRTASSDLLNVLVQPLYGDSPEIGVRELVQNAVDAVLERRQYHSQELIHNSSARSLSDDVVVCLGKGVDGHWWLSVADNGVGMTVDTVVNYYLTIGSTLRRDPTWRQRFEDSHSRSRILRSGRFGIGVLAAFLLGDRIEVSTRHLDTSAEEGIEFACGIDDDIIELNRVTRSPGTTVRIRVTPDVANGLRELSWQRRERWDWYTLRDPRVVRRIEGRRDPLPQAFTIPSAGEQLPSGWRRLVHPDFRDIHWSYSHEPALTCNGIVVIDGPLAPEPLWEDASNGYALGMPNLSVFDPDCRLPLDLTRSGLTSRTLPFQKQLIESVCSDFLAYCLTHAPTVAPDSKALGTSESVSAHAGLVIGTRDQYWHGLSHGWFYTAEGVSFLDRHLLLWSGVRSVLLFNQAYSSTWLDGLALDRNYAVIPITRDVQLNWRYGVPEAPIGGYNYPELCHVSARRFLDSDARDAEPRSPYSRRRWKAHGLNLWDVGNCPSATIDFRAVAARIAALKPKEQAAAWGAEVYVSATQPRRRVSPIAKLWRRVIQRPILPYDYEERQRVLDRAFSKLKSSIACWEQGIDGGQESRPGVQ